MSTINQRGCSHCLVEAIQTRNETRLRALLSSPATCFLDTFWAPVPTYYYTSLSGIYLNFIGIYFDVERESTSSASEDPSPRDICVHHQIDPEMLEPLETGPVDKVAVNVLAMAMLFSTPNFNALNVCIESGRFNIIEPIVLHEVNQHWDNRNKLEDCEIDFGSESIPSLNIVHLVSNGPDRVLLSF